MGAGQTVKYSWEGLSRFYELFISVLNVITSFSGDPCLCYWYFHL